MPIYEYKCDGCSEVFEVFQKVSDPAPERHVCGSTQVHRVLSNTSFVLKGTGWYATDYAKKDSGGGRAGHKKDGEDKAESKASETASGAKGDAGSKKGDGGGGSSGGGGGGSAAA